MTPLPTETEDLRGFQSIREECRAFREIIGENSRFCEQTANNRGYFDFFRENYCILQHFLLQ